jgi:uncharacterized protein (AIM24 family)
MGALKRAVGGESAFVSSFTARSGPGEVTRGSQLTWGHCRHRDEQSAFLRPAQAPDLAGDTSLQIETRWGGAKSFFGGEGLFVLQVTGFWTAAGLIFRSNPSRTPCPG